MNGQAGGLSVRAGKRSEPGGLEKKRIRENRSSEKHAGKLDKTNREHSNKYTGDNGEDG
jgi:hypothetical protein